MVSTYNNNNNNILLFIALDQINSKLHYNSQDRPGSRLFTSKITTIIYAVINITRGLGLTTSKDSPPPRLQDSSNVWVLLSFSKFPSHFPIDVLTKRTLYYIITVYCYIHKYNVCRCFDPQTVCFEYIYDINAQSFGKRLCQNNIIHL